MYNCTLSNNGLSKPNASIVFWYASGGSRGLRSKLENAFPGIALKSKYEITKNKKKTITISKNRFIV